jgi:hypothetical protein
MLQLLYYFPIISALSIDELLAPSMSLSPSREGKIFLNDASISAISCDPSS